MPTDGHVSGIAVHVRNHSPKENTRVPVGTAIDDDTASVLLRLVRHVCVYVRKRRRRRRQRYRKEPENLQCISRSSSLVLFVMDDFDLGATSG